MPGRLLPTFTRCVRVAPLWVQLTVWAPVLTFMRMLDLVPFDAPSTAKRQLPPMAMATRVPLPPDDSLRARLFLAR